MSNAFTDYKAHKDLVNLYLPSKYTIFDWACIALSVITLFVCSGGAK